MDMGDHERLTTDLEAAVGRDGVISVSADCDCGTRLEIWRDGYVVKIDYISVCPYNPEAPNVAEFGTLGELRASSWYFLRSCYMRLESEGQKYYMTIH